MPINYYSPKQLFSLIKTTDYYSVDNEFVDKKLHVLNCDMSV